MRLFLIACPMIMLSLAAAAQSLPSAPSLPVQDQAPMAAPNINPQAGPSDPGSATSVPGTSQTPNSIDQAKTEAECKIPTNATKPECVQLMLKQ
ncbi:MAG TPA: hypothetical protein VET85_11480 [Stellaceae bacterium]|nr:hypothetical protein [Stellaceae bacterium]